MIVSDCLAVPVLTRGAAAPSRARRHRDRTLAGLRRAPTRPPRRCKHAAREHTRRVVSPSTSPPYVVRHTEASEPGFRRTQRAARRWPLARCRACCRPLAYRYIRAPIASRPHLYLRLAKISRHVPPSSFYPRARRDCARATSQNLRVHRSSRTNASNPGRVPRIPAVRHTLRRGARTDTIAHRARQCRLPARSRAIAAAAAAAGHCHCRCCQQTRTWCHAKPRAASPAHVSCLLACVSNASHRSV